MIGSYIHLLKEAPSRAETAPVYPAQFLQGHHWGEGANAIAHPPECVPTALSHQPRLDLQALKSNTPCHSVGKKAETSSNSTCKIARGNDLAVMSWANIPQQQSHCSLTQDQKVQVWRTLQFPTLCCKKLHIRDEPGSSRHLRFVTFREHSHFRMKFTVEI